MRKYIYILVVLSILAACKQKGISERLDEIDSLVVAEKYDSAYSVLSEIKESFIVNLSDKAHYYLLLTQVGYLTNKPQTTDSLLDISITYYKNHNDNKGLAEGYYYKSNREMLAANYSQAILYCKEAELRAQGYRQQYKIAERLTFLNELSGNYTIQLDYAKKSLRLASLSKNKQWMAYSYNNIGEAFSNLDKYDSALYYIDKTIPYIKY